MVARGIGPHSLLFLASLEENCADFCEIYGIAVFTRQLVTWLNAWCQCRKNGQQDQAFCHVKTTVALLLYEPLVYRVCEAHSTVKLLQLIVLRIGHSKRTSAICYGFIQEPSVKIKGDMIDEFVQFIASL